MSKLDENGNAIYNEDVSIKSTKLFEPDLKKSLIKYLIFTIFNNH